MLLSRSKTDTVDGVFAVSFVAIAANNSFGGRGMSGGGDSVDQLIAGLRSGDSQAMQRFWDCYGPMLERLVDRNLAQPLRRRVGSEDVVQSACRTFLRRAQNGEFDIPDADAFWRLLCTIALTKLRQQARYHGQQKRDLRHEQSMDSVDQHGRPKAASLEGAIDTPDAALAFADEFDALMASLDPRERDVLELKLQDIDNVEIAQRLGCTERTVRRRLQQIGNEFERRLLQT